MTLTNSSSWHIAFGHGSVASRSMSSNRSVDIQASIIHLASYTVIQKSPTDNIREKPSRMNEVVGIFDRIIAFLVQGPYLGPYRAQNGPYMGPNMDHNMGPNMDHNMVPVWAPNLGPFGF